MKPLINISIAIVLLLIGQTAWAQLKDAKEKTQRSLKNATEAFQELQDMGPDQGIPLALLKKAEGIVIFPKSLKVALGVGGQGGRGFAIIKKDDGHWSNPYFVGMGEASVGAQIGVQSADIILLFKHRENLMDLEKGDVTIGGDIGLAAGPVGRNSSATTDIGFEAEIYSYSRSKGLYAGISLEGSVLRANHNLNQAYYDLEGTKNIEKIFYQLTTPYDKQVSAFIAAVDQADDE